MDVIGGEGGFEELDGPKAASRSASLPIPWRYVYVAQEADPKGNQSDHPDYLRIVLTVSEGQEVEVDIALSSGETGCTAQEPSHLLIVSASEVVCLMSVEALAEDDGAGDMNAPVPGSRNA